MRGKGKKLYNNYAPEETMVNSNEDKDDWEMANKLRWDPFPPSTFEGMMRVKPEVLAVEEAKKCMLKEEEHCICREKSNVEEPLVKEEIVQLKVFLLDRERERV